jgi:hypothetical protein
MRIMVERCYRLDVHQKAVFVCLLIGALDVRPAKEVRTFRTMTRELETLRDWSKAAALTALRWHHSNPRHACHVSSVAQSLGAAGGHGSLKRRRSDARSMRNVA